MARNSGSDLPLSACMSTSYVFSIQKAEGIQWSPGHLHAQRPNPYVKIYRDGVQIHRTPTVKRSVAPQFDEFFVLSSEKATAVLSLKLFHDASVLRDPCIGAVTMQLDALWTLCNAEATPKVAVLQLLAVDEASKEKPAGRLIVRLERMTPAHAQDAVDEVQTAVAARGLGCADPLTNAADLAFGLKALIAKLDLFLKIGDGVTKIIPYANAAWKILTSVYEAVKEQGEADDKVFQLVQTMVDIYSFVEDVEFLSLKVQRLKSNILEIARQTLECALFICEYLGYGFSVRLIRNTWSDTGRKIDGLSVSLQRLKDAFDRALAVQSLFFSTKIMDSVESLVQSDKLRGLNPLTFDASLRPECLPGTRRDVLTIVTELLTTPSKTSNILWLHGVAGAGKSTISTTISEVFRGLNRLGAFLFFDRNNTSGSNPGAVIRTIAYWLASSNPHIRTAVCDAIETDATLVTAPLQTQFHRLLLEPLVASQDYILGPIVVILDALDECGDADSRESLLALIVNEFQKLPTVFRFLIVSRPDSDIVTQFRGRPHIVPMQLDITTESTKRDIVAYLHLSMQNIRLGKPNLKREPDWPGQDVINTLADYSGGLFIWASTACKFIRSFDPRERLAIILSAGIASGLDGLYTIALRNSAVWNNETFAHNARLVLGAIVLCRMALTEKTLDELLGFAEGRSAEVLEYLGCVIQWSPGQSARILHTSFSDYLTDPHRSGHSLWFVDSKIQSRSVALGCLRILNSHLHFNICNLEDSHVLNRDVPDLSNRIEKHIPAAYAYAGLFWSHHLYSTDLDSEILVELKGLMHDKFLHWLEVLSLLNQVPIASESLEILRNWVGKTDETFQNLLRDAIRFLAGFAPLIAQSVPHIYISALALAPRESLVRRQYASSFCQTFCFTGPLGDNWSSMLKVFHGHTDGVLSVAWSPDGMRIVSGSKDKTVRIWDSETGNVVVGPIEGHTTDVTTVLFSPDAQRIVSGESIYSSIHDPSQSGTKPKAGKLRIWDAKTGALVANPLVHFSISAVVCSPDGKWLASGASHSRVQLCDLKTGAISGLFKGHTGWVSSVAFSFNAKRLASGSGDRTVRVWDVVTGALVAGPFEGHQDGIRSLAFSRDGSRVVSGSDDGTVRIWDSEIGSLVAGPFLGHTGWIMSVGFSSDGNRILSGSWDETVRIWNTETVSVIGAFEGHSGKVHSVAFSPDEGRFCSGSEDKTVRVWDPNIAVPITKRFAGHTSGVHCVAFSPDGKYLASGSEDHTVQVWDALRTGALVGSPFQHPGAVYSISFSPDSRRIVCAGDHSVNIWNFQTGATIGLDRYTNGTSILSASFSPDGHQIVSGFSDGRIRIFSSETGDIFSELVEVHDNGVSCVVFSADGQRLVSGSWDNTLRIWDAKTGDLVVGPLIGHTDGICAVSFSSDGHLVCSGSCDCTIRIWDAQTGIAVGEELEGYENHINSVDFSPDGAYIVSGSSDMTLRLWNSKTGALVAGPFEGHTGEVTSVAFHPDGTQIVSGSEDATIRVWEIRESLRDWGNHPRFENGWIMNSSSEHILWVPPWLRDGICLPWNSRVIRAKGTTELDLSHFVHGPNWQKCTVQPALTV
ncbi:WD40-repeat-containing domain protein [Mycena capillaripes]|nr:WD40-repeat-containing domain protein [Mycena capillaripes]